MDSLGRRSFMKLAGIVGVSMLSGCSLSDPRITGGPTTPPPQPPASPLPVIPGHEAALRHAVDLAHLSGLLEGAGTGLTANQSKVVAWIATAQEQQVTALLGANPTDRPTSLPTPGPRTTPRPRPTPEVTRSGSPVGQLTELLDEAVADNSESAVGARGSTALLWGSLATYAVSAREALRSDTSRPEPPVADNRPIDLWSDTEAAQQVLRQIHALIYGYQTAIPALPRAQQQAAFDTMVQRRGLRDQIADLLRTDGHTTPAAEPAYELPVDPDSPAAANELIWRMELAFQPFAGAWIAAATDDEVRELALNTLTEASQLCIRRGGPIPVWPGWPS